MRRSQILTATALAVLFAQPAGAFASIGTGVGATPLTLSTPAKAGRTYALRWLYVKNTGSVVSNYAVHAQRLAGGSGRTIPAAWVSVSPARFQLRPDAIRTVGVKVAIPAGTAGGSYLTDLVASTYTHGAPGSTALGAAAADKLVFDVPSSTSFPWLMIVIAGGIACLLGLGWLARRSGVRLRLESPA
ncbi:MAG TPA: hypothetical protein VEJ23_10055 [Solirubrobacteraceae bacterium]|nr:hypothetical protein [Solirubrobacteraceae bacterium]